MLTSDEVKQDFPIFETLGDGYAYLDNAATTQKPRSVLDAIHNFYTSQNSNVYRGIYRLSEDATDSYHKARRNIADFIGSGNPDSLIFTRNATESLNLVASSLGRGLRPGDEVLISIMEHHSNIVPWQLWLPAGVKLKYADIDSEGHLDMESFQENLTGRTKIVSLVHESNLLGTINNAMEIGRIAHDNGAVFILDGAQSVPHMPVDVERLGCDFLAFSGHKMLGPMGIGCLYGRIDILEKMPPFLGGGEMIREVYRDHSVWNDVPQKFEAGTPNVAGAIGLSAAVDYLRSYGMENVRSHEKRLMKKTFDLEQEAGIPELISYGPKELENRGGIYSFNIGKIAPMDLESQILEESSLKIGSAVHPHDVASSLDGDKIAVRSGHHCAMPLTHRLGVVATSRASYYIYNSESDVENLFQAIANVAVKYHER